MPADGKNIYLTFDDGPHPEITVEVMDLLESHGFKGTFFCIGDNVSKYPETYRSIIERGHSVGNHTYHHVNGLRTADEEYLDEVKQCKEVVDSSWFRPPYGRIKKSQIRALKSSYKLVLWSLLSWDFKQGLDTKKSLKKLRKYTRPGTIVVFHDSEKAYSNLMEILPAYLQFLKEENYRSEVFS